MSSITYSDERVDSHSRVAWPRVAAISSMVAFSLPTFITGIEVYLGLSVTDTMLALLIGSLLLVVIGGAMGAIGARTGLSSYLLVRIAFGRSGAGLVNLAFALSLLGWFGVNLDLFSGAIVRLAEDVFATALPAWPLELFGGLCMVLTTVYGFKAINLLASLLVPVLAVLTCYMFYSAHQVMTLEQFWALEKSASLTLSGGVSAIVGAIIIGAIILPDITRFCRHWTGGVHTAFWAYMVVELVVLFVAAFAAAAMGKSEILDLMLALGLGMSAFVLVIAGSWVLNSLNLYSTVLSIEATFPRLKSGVVTCVLGALGVVAAFANILDQFITFLIFLAAIFVPVSGVILADYLLLRRQMYLTDKPMTEALISVPAFIAWLLGASLSLAAEPLALPSVSGILVIDVIVLTALSYILLFRLSGQHRLMHARRESDKPNQPLSQQVS